jgi:hypothetical protein
MRKPAIRGDAGQIASTAEDSANSRFSFVFCGDFRVKWSGRLDSNQRPPAPKAEHVDFTIVPKILAQKH